MNTYTYAAAPMPTTTLSVSAAHLMHTAVAYNSPEVTTLDRIIALQSSGALRVAATATTSARPTVRSLPVEVLLEIRAQLLPSVAAQTHARAQAALAAFERALPERLCAECVSYNEDVHGPVVWEWPNFCGGCDCPPRAGASARGLAKDAAGTWVRPKAHRSARLWVEDHLATQLPGSTKIWPAVDAMLAEVGCRVAAPPHVEDGDNCSVELVSAAPDASDAPERLQRAKRVFDLYEQETPASASTAPMPYAPLAQPKTATFAWPPAQHGCIAPTGAYGCPTALLVEGLAASAASALAGLRGTLASAARLHPRAAAAARREPALFGAFAVALAARVVVAAVC